MRKISSEAEAFFNRMTPEIIKQERARRALERARCKALLRLVPRPALEESPLKQESVTQCE